MSAKSYFMEIEYFKDTASFTFNYNRALNHPLAQSARNYPSPGDYFL